MTNDLPSSISLEMQELNRAMRQIFESQARARGFTQGQWRVLWHLQRNQGISQAGLAELLNMQPISLARVIDRLETQGVVQRRPDPTDRRALKLYLTPAAGQQIQVLQQLVEDINTKACVDIDVTQQTILATLLRRMRHNLETAQRRFGMSAAIPAVEVQS